MVLTWVLLGGTTKPGLSCNSLASKLDLAQTELIPMARIAR